MRFRTYITAVLAATALIPFLSLSLFEYANIDKTIEQKDREQEEAVALAGLLIRERVLQISHVAHFAREEFQRLRAQSPTLDADRVETLLKQTVESFPVLSNLHIDERTGEKAHVLAFYPERHDHNTHQRGEDHSLRWHARIAPMRPSGPVYFSPVILSSRGPTSPILTFAITTPEQRYILSGALEVNRLFADLETNFTEQGVELIVLDSEQQIIYPISPERKIVRWNGGLKNRTSTLYEGTSRFITTSALPSVDPSLPNWHIIVAKLDSSRLAIKQSLFLRTSLYSVLILLFTVLIASLVSRPLKRALGKLVQDLDAAHFGKRETEIDEGPNELRQFQHAYRATRESLDDHINQLKHINRELSHLVEQRSQELTAEALLFRQVFDAMDDAVLLLDEKWGVQQVNQSARALLPEHRLKALLVKAQAFYADNPSEHLLFEEQALILECRLIRFTARRATLRQGYCLLVRDITQKANLEQMKADLIGIVAHELKTPITTSKLELENLNNAGVPASVTDAMRHDLDHLERIVSDWLKVVKIDGGSFAVDPTFTQLTPILKRAIRQVRTKYTFAITLHIPEEAECIWADPHALLELFVNLITNACRYARPHTEPTITIRAHLVGEQLTINVLDRGLGIEPHERERIFDRFYQIHRGTRRINGGTGLGLVISRAICRAHQGDIVATEDEGQTCFKITLPQPRSFSNALSGETP